MSIKFIQLPTCHVAEFVAAAATSFDVAGFLYNDGTTPVDPADIGDVCFATLEPKTAREELISFTIDSVTAGGVATITATRGLSQKSPYGTGGAAFDHQNGSDFVISNNPGLFNKLAAKANDETITGSWQFPAPSHVNNPATKTYTDTAVATKVGLTGDEEIAGEKTFTTAPKIPDSAAADEAVTRGEFDDEAVVVTGDQTVAGVKTFSSSPIVPTATTATQAVNKSQVESYIAANSGDIKASDSTYGTTKLDVAADTPSDPKALTATADRVSALSGGGDFGTPSVSNQFVTEEYIGDGVRTAYDYAGSPYTWMKKSGLKKAFVQVWGAGASGNYYVGSTSDDEGIGGGGGGAYIEKWFAADELGATETITIGAGGAAKGASSGGGVGNNGGDTTFGSLLSADGGYAGAGGDKRNGGNGGISFWDYGIGGDTSETASAHALFGGGGGGRGAATEASTGGGKSMYGGGGGASARTNPAVDSVGTSLYGGNGGAAAANSGGNATASAGSVPGGGGGAAFAGTGFTATSGAGANGRVIVTEFYA